MNSSARNWCVPSYRTWTVRTTQKRSGAGPIRPTRPARAPCRWSAQPSGTFFYLIWFDLTLFFFSTAVLSFNSGWWLLSLPAGRDDVDDGVFTGFFFAGVRSYFEEGGGQDGEGRGQGKKKQRGRPTGEVSFIFWEWQLWLCRTVYFSTPTATKIRHSLQLYFFSLRFFFLYFILFARGSLSFPFRRFYRHFNDPGAFFFRPHRTLFYDDQKRTASFRHRVWLAHFDVLRVHLNEWIIADHQQVK